MESVRYSSSKEAEKAMNHRDIKIKNMLLSSIPSFEKIILNIKNQKISVTKYNPSLTTNLIHTDEKFEEFNNKKYPLNLRFKILSTDHDAVKYFDLTMESLPTAAQFSFLKSQIIKEETHETDVKSDSAAAATFSGPISVFKYSKYFGVYIGVNAEARTLAKNNIEAELLKSLDYIFPELEKKLSDPAKIKDIGLNQAQLVEKKIKNMNTTDVFNPYGPLYDEYARESISIGDTKLIILFSPDQVDVNQRPNSIFLNWLNEIFAKSLKLISKTETQTDKR